MPRLLLVLLFLSPSLLASDWQVRKQRDGITVSTRSVEGSVHKEVRAEMELDSDLSSLVALVQDTDACHELSDLCRESRVLEKRSDTEFVIYSYNDIPWPVKDRDAVTRVTWEQDPDTQAVMMLATVIESDVAETKAVRIRTATTSWVFEPLPSGRIRVISQAHVDPEGPTPAWLSNMLLISQPLATMANVRDILKTGRYEGHSFSFLQEAPVATTTLPETARD